jgi:hypothetical protein
VFGFRGVKKFIDLSASVDFAYEETSYIVGVRSDCVIFLKPNRMNSTLTLGQLSGSNYAVGIKVGMHVND